MTVSSFVYDLQAKRTVLCDQLLQALESNFESHINLVGLATSGMVLQNDIDNYFELLANSQYGPIKDRVVGALSSSIWLYEDVGICTNVGNPSCPVSAKEVAEKKMNSHAIVLWPLFIPCKIGHWVLAVIYPKTNHVALIDSSIDKNIHGQVFEVRRTTKYYI